MDVRIAGRAGPAEVAAVLAVLAGVRPAAPDRLTTWREQRRAAVRRTVQQTR